MPTPSRSSRSGRHVAPRAERTPTTPRPTRRRPAGRVAKTAVAVVLMVSVGSFAKAMPSDITQSPLMADVSGARTQRAAAAAAAEQLTTRHRTAVVAAAAAAAVEAQSVRTASVQGVPAATLTQLDQAAAELDRLLAAAGDPVGSAASASPAPTDLATSPAPTDPATASPAPTDLATSPAPTDTAMAAPTAEATTGATEPSPAATDSTGASASPSAATTPTADPSAPTASSDAASASAAALDALAVVPAQVEDAATTELRTAASKVAALAAQITQAVRDQQSAADAAAAAARVAAEEAATRSAQRVSLDQYANGQIPAAALCPLSFAPSAELRCDATAAIEQLNVAYRQQFGTDLTIDDSYRSLSSQFACRRTKGSLCAVPGTSNHGLGKAVDLGGGAQSFGTTQHNWLVANAGTYGWTWPAWAHLGGSKPEPWHWEYTG